LSRIKKGVKKVKESFEESIANRTVAPLILKLLSPYTATDMNTAISNNLDLAEGLSNDPSYLAQIQNIVSLFPYADKAAKKLYSEKWIKWFIENPMKRDRHDLYLQIVYCENGTRYLRRQIRHIVELVFSIPE